MYDDWRPYVPVYLRRQRAEREMARRRKKGQPVSPVVILGRTIAKTFWGKSWCRNLEGYSDYSNRLPRGRTYVRNGSVVDLQIGPGDVRAWVSGSSLYEVRVEVAAVPRARWTALCKDCAGGIDSLVELLQGRLSKGVMERICRQKTGLFSSPREIEFDCSCPDWASMCKHVATVLYGVGARLDERPELLFALRKVDEKDLIAKARTFRSPGKGLWPGRSSPRRASPKSSGSRWRRRARPRTRGAYGRDAGGTPVRRGVRGHPPPAALDLRGCLASWERNQFDRARDREAIPKEERPDSLRAFRKTRRDPGGARLFAAEAAYADSMLKSVLGGRGCIEALGQALQAVPTYAPALLSLGSVESCAPSRRGGGLAVTIKGSHRAASSHDGVQACMSPSHPNTEAGGGSSRPRSGRTMGSTSWAPP